MDNKSLPLAAHLQDLQEYVVSAFESCTGGWKGRAEFILSRIVEIQELVKREGKTMTDVPHSIELLSQAVAEAALRSQKERLALEEEIAALRAENANLKAEIAALEDLLDSYPDASKNGREPERYHGCYNLGERKTPIKSVSEVILILGGQKHLAEALGISAGVVNGWKDTGKHLPSKFRERIDALMEERRYTVDRLLYK